MNYNYIFFILIFSIVSLSVFSQSETGIIKSKIITKYIDPKPAPRVEYNYQFCDDWAYKIDQIEFSYQMNLNNLFDGIGISWEVKVRLLPFYDVCTDNCESGFLTEQNYIGRSKTIGLEQIYGSPKVQELLNSVSLDIDIPIGIWMEDKYGNDQRVINKRVKAWSVSQDEPYKDWMFISYSDLDENWKDKFSKEEWLNSIEKQANIIKNGGISKNDDHIINIEPMFLKLENLKITFVGGCLENEMKAFRELERVNTKIQDWHFDSHEGLVRNATFKFHTGRDTLTNEEYEKLKEIKWNLLRAKSLMEFLDLGGTITFRDERIFEDLITTGSTEELIRKMEMIKRVEEVYGEIKLEYEEIENQAKELLSLKTELLNQKNEIDNESNKLRQLSKSNYSQNKKNITNNLIKAKSTLNSEVKLNSFQDPNTKLYGVKSMNDEIILPAKYYKIVEIIRPFIIAKEWNNSTNEVDSWVFNFSGEKLFKGGGGYHTHGGITLYAQNKVYEDPVNYYYFDIEKNQFIFEYYGGNWLTDMYQNKAINELSSQNKTYSNGDYFIQLISKTNNLIWNRLELFYYDRFGVGVQFDEKWHELMYKSKSQHINSQFRTGSGGRVVSDKKYSDGYRLKVNILEYNKESGEVKIIKTTEIGYVYSFYEGSKRSPEYFRNNQDQFNFLETLNNKLGSGLVLKTLNQGSQNLFINKKSLTEDIWGNPINQFLNTPYSQKESDIKFNSENAIELKSDSPWEEQKSNTKSESSDPWD